MQKEMGMDLPNYSVLMSVYQKEKAEFLRASMDSMWNQTVKTNDFVLVCDGPLTETLENVIEEMTVSHPEINVIRLKKNSGLGNALNEGLKHCKNDLVARMDSDDISLPQRCEVELKAFMTHSDIDICSGTILEFQGEPGNVVGKRVLPAENSKIRDYSRKRNPFNHVAVMFSKKAVEAAGGYVETFHLFEDYYLWIRMLQNGARGWNVEEPIVYVRMSDDAYMRRGGIAYTREMLRFHQWIYSTGWSSKADFMTGAIPHMIVCIMPNEVRRAVYKRLRD